MLLVENGTLIDGTGAAPIPNASVLVDGNVIKAVGSKIEVPADVARIDAQGGTILPGFIDTHVHVMIEGAELMNYMVSPFSLNFYKAITYLRRSLDAGITSVRDAGGADLGVKQAVELGLIEGPRLQISITVMGITGGHVGFG